MNQIYDQIGMGYSFARRTDPRWAAAILDALGDADPIVNVGAGAGSYEPAGRTVLAVEPSTEMVRQRPATASPAVRAVAEALPVPDQAAAAALAVLTVHHWPDWRRGVAELRRVAPLRVVLAYDTQRHTEFWLVREYVPEIADLERSRPSAGEIAAELGAHTVIPLPLPHDFTDGVLPAYWRRPAAYLDPRVRLTCSALAQTEPAAVERGLARLRADLESGHWHDTHQDVLAAEEWDAGFRLIIS